MRAKLPLLYGIGLGLISGASKLYSYHPSYSKSIQEMLGYVPITSLVIGIGICMAHLRFTVQAQEGISYKNVVGAGVKVALVASIIIGALAYFSKSFDTYTAFTGNLVIGMALSFILGVLFKKNPTL